MCCEPVLVCSYTYGLSHISARDRHPSVVRRVGFQVILTSKTTARRTRLGLSGVRGTGVPTGRGTGPRIKIKNKRTTRHEPTRVDESDPTGAVRVYPSVYSTVLRSASRLPPASGARSRPPDPRPDASDRPPASGQPDCEVHTPRRHRRTARPRRGVARRVDGFRSVRSSSVSRPVRQFRRQSQADEHGHAPPLSLHRAEWALAHTRARPPDPLQYCNIPKTCSGS